MVYAQLLRYRGRHQSILDERIRLLAEIINNIRAIKLYAYETLMGKKVTLRRQAEVQLMWRLAMCNSVSVGIMYFIPTLAAIGKSDHMVKLNM